MTRQVSWLTVFGPWPGIRCAFPLALDGVGSGVAANSTVHSCGGSRGLDRVPFLASAWAEEPRKRKATHGFVMGQWAWPFGFVCISVAAVTASYGFALTASPFFKRRSAGPAKRNQKAFAPAYGTSLRLSVPSLRCPPGGIAYGLLRCTSSRCMRLRRTALRAYPLMDTSARPAEGAKNQEPEPEPDQKPNTPRPSPLTTMSVSSSTAFDRKVRRQAEWRD